MAKSPEPTKPVNLTCEQCGHENEAERVYCHNCGGKLDRSLLPKEDPKTSTQAAVEAARKHVAKMTNPGSGGVLPAGEMVMPRSKLPVLAMRAAKSAALSAVI